MLDAYIINRIRRERQIDREHSTLIPLRIHVPEPAPPSRIERDGKRDESGDPSIVDFQL